MENSMTIPMIFSGSEKRANSLSIIYSSLLEEFKRGKIGYSTIGLLGQSCIASIAVMLLLMHEMPVAIKMVSVFLVTILCMGYNATILAQLKSKVRFNALILSVVFSSIVIIANLF